MMHQAQAAQAKFGMMQAKMPAKPQEVSSMFASLFLTRKKNSTLLTTSRHLIRCASKRRPRARGSRTRRKWRIQTKNNLMSPSCNTSNLQLNTNNNNTRSPNNSRRSTNSSRNNKNKLTIITIELSRIRRCHHHLF